MIGTDESNVASVGNKPTDDGDSRTGSPPALASQSALKSPLLDRQNQQPEGAIMNEPMDTTAARSPAGCSNSMPCSPDHSPHPKAAVPSVNTAVSKLERFPLTIRDTFEWIIGRSRRKGDVNKENRNNPNTITNQPTTSAKKTGVVSASHSSSTKARKATSSEACVADFFDDAMLDKLTELPYAVDRNEWLATHTLALFEHVNALCGTVSDHCTPVTCPSMSYPGCTKAYWFDERGRKYQYSAGRYIDCVMSFCEAARKNESIYPTKYGVPFPADFEQHCRKVLRLLWHCCGHLYAKHWDLMSVLNLRPQCGLVLAHMAAIAKLFVLLDSKELSSLTNTLYLVRPPSLQAPPAKRSGGVGEQLGFSMNDSNAFANYNTGSVHWSRGPTAKSGSWGGQSTTVSMSPAANRSSGGKNALVHTNYAQTC